MNPEVKQLWTSALRSGQFKQGKQALCKGNRYCCLGVLCELAVKAGVVDKRQTEAYTSYGHKDDRNVTYLPQAVTDWAGLDEDDPLVPEVGRPYINASLSLLNDDGWTFKEIADVIDKHL